MAGKQPKGWPSEAEQAASNERASALWDAMSAGKDPAPLRHPLAGPFVRLGQHDPPAALQIGFSQSGRLICTGLLIGWQLNAIGDASKVPMDKRTELTARAVHGIRLGEILNDLEPLPEDGGSPKRKGKGSTGAVPVPRWLQQSVPVVRPPHPGAKGYPDSHYQKVAEVYLTALMVAPGSPIKWLSEQFPCSEATAHRWRNEAEKRGFLPERPRARRGPPSKSRRKG
ncbi:MAG: hypothetical protein ACLQPH_18660 [Acidimicrobiales bacterium]